MSTQLYPYTDRMRIHESSSTSSRRCNALGACIALLIGMLLLLPDTSDAKPVYRAHSLTVVVPGINDRASRGWLGNAGAISPSREEFIVRPHRTAESAKGNPSMTASFEWQSPATGVPDDHIIRFDPEDPESVARLTAAAQMPNAMFIVDMNLGITDLRPRRRVWDEQTKWAATAINSLATAHIAEHPDSHTVLLGHSAGTDAMLEAQLMERDRTNGSPRKLFNVSVAASPRDPSRFYDKSTLMVTADGDFSNTPGGAVGSTVWRRMTKQDSQNLAKEGFSVLRFVNPPTGRLDVASPFRALEAHTRVADLARPNQVIEAYSPIDANVVELPKTSVADAINAITQASSDAVYSPSSRRRALADAAQELRKSEPTPGLGGISLNAVARVPIDVGTIASAVYNVSNKRLILITKSGREISSPTIEPQVARLAYQSTFIAGDKPELSIGSTHFTTPEGRQVLNLHSPGRQPVVYLGGTDGTQLGLTMFLADKALARLTFGSTRKVSGVAAKVRGFHSIAELYPAKYSNHPSQGRYSGDDTRVFLNSSTVQLALEPDGRSMSFDAVRFSIQFGQNGPAESAFADFFATHFDEIIRTREGAPLARLIPHAKAVALFRWIKEYKVQFDPASVSGVPIARVLTPRDTDVVQLPSLAEIRPKSPIVLFGENGPLRMIGDGGQLTTFTYKKGKVHAVRRNDGTQVTVLRDGVGNPIGLEGTDRHAALIYIDKELGPVIAHNVRVKRSAAGVSAHLLGNAILFPDTQPEASLSRVLSKFISEEAR